MAKDTVYWTTNTGKKISVDEMSIDHLRNTLKMIIRKNHTSIKRLPKVVLSGEMANMFNDDQELDELLDEIGCDLG